MVNAISGQGVENTLATTGKTVTFGDYIAKNEKAIQSLLVKNIKVEYIERLALNAYSKNPQLANCSFESILKALMDALAMGIVPFTIENEGYIIPYKQTAQFQFGYRGILKVCRNTGLFQNIYTRIVYNRDEFYYEYGLQPKLVHKPIINPPKDYYINDNITHFYSAYVLLSGGFDFVVWTKEQVDKHRDRYTKANLSDPSAIWNKEYPQMGQKTLLIMNLKYAPKSRELLENLAKDETVKRELAPEPEDFLSDKESEFRSHRIIDVAGSEIVAPEEQKTKDNTKVVNDDKLSAEALKQGQSGKQAKDEEPPAQEALINPKLEKIKAYTKDLNIKPDELKVLCFDIYHVSDPENLTEANMDDFLSKLEARISKEAKK